MILFIHSSKLNIVQKVTTPDFSALLTADIGSSVEEYLISQYTGVSNNALNADILKVAHHGSKYSSTPLFLEPVSPTIAVIQVGEGNTYGHPTQETLDNLASSSVQAVFRNDINGTITIKRGLHGLEAMTER